MSDDKKPKIISYDDFQHFIESSPLTSGAVRWTVPNKKLFETDDKLTWTISGERPYPVMDITPFQAIVDKRYEKLREDFGYGGTKKAFNELKNQLQKEGKKPAKYGLNDDEYAFNRAYNKRKKRRLRKK